MTPNKEDYLKCIYQISETGEKITNKLIAELMQVSAPSVSEMVKKMLAQEWIVKDSQQGFALTDQGLALVALLYRKHRLLEVFLIQELHYTTDQVHAEAEVLEHTVSDTFIDRLEESLSFPSHCPHGGVIPGKGAALIETYQDTLDKVTKLGRYQLRRVHDDFDLLHYMDRQQLTIGLTFDLLAIDSYAKTHTIRYGEKELAIPWELAKNFFVVKN